MIVKSRESQNYLVDLMKFKWSINRLPQPDQKQWESVLSSAAEERYAPAGNSAHSGRKGV
jgi:hypothetical protein